MMQLDLFPYESMLNNVKEIRHWISDIKQIDF